MIMMGKSYVHKLEGKFAQKILPEGKLPITDITYMDLADYFPYVLRRKWSRNNWKKGRDKLKLRLKKTHEFFKSYEL